MKNDIIEIEITDITPEGFGVGRLDGKVVFIADTAVGDRVRAIVLKELKNQTFAKVFEILSSSQDRIESDCAVSRKCGGCALRHISYEAERRLKRKFVSDAMKRIGNLEPEILETVCGNSENYRNKVQYPFSKGKNGECIYGYYARRSHRIVEHKGCKLQDALFEEIASFTAETANRLFIPAYDEQNGQGVLRHIVMRKNRKGEVLVCLVVAKNTKKTLMLAEAIAENFANVVGIHQNINKRRDNVIFGDETEKLIGDEVLRDTLCGKIFEISPRSFYQVNADMAEKLYNRAKELLNEREKPSVILDLYCGAGTIGLCVAEDTDMLCGVEIVDSAVENAKKNARLNGRNGKNTLFVCGDASLGVKECRKKFGNPDTIIVDPPRKGLEKSVIETVVNANPKQILYISCDPATLARDCKIFAEFGYKIPKAEPFDLFPRTGHVETVVCLSREKANAPSRNFRIAQQDDAEHVMSLYQSAKSSAFCVWNDSYPSIAEIEHDLETKNLYVMTEDSKVIGAISVVPENELDDFHCWSCKNGKEIARVVIDRAYQGRGLSFEMVQRIESVLREKGHISIRLSVVKSNIPAYKTYIKAGFAVVGEAQMYGNDYYLMEKAIDTNSPPKRITDEMVVCLSK